jgi:uncharacterized protein (DUF608 family)
MRKCNCSGHCGSSPEGLSRREFIEWMGAGAATALAGGTALAAEPAEALASWKRALLEPTSPRVYRSAVHTDARMHLGGIGTGNFELGVDGQFTNWQLFNTLRDGHVPLHFAVKIGQSAKLLQTTGGPDWPRVREIEMTGEYPFAVLRFLDPDLPLRLELTAFSPFAPLDMALSSTPLAVLVFKAHNPTSAPQSLSLAALLQNPVGYDGHGVNEWAANRHPNFGGNVNEPLREGPVRGLRFRAVQGAEPTLDRPVRIVTNVSGLDAPPADRPLQLKLGPITRLTQDAKSSRPEERMVVWLEDAPADLSEATLRAARDAVQAGATLVFSGKTQPLLNAYAAAADGQPLVLASTRADVVFEDFERGYAKWQVSGTALGEAPARGTLPNQQRVSGFLGQGLVNTYLDGDDTTGRLTSQPFVIGRRFIRFLVGGGRHATTQMRLVVGGQVVRSIAGKDNERLEPTSWDVREFEGQTAHLEIVDAQKGPWGHVNVDHIEFSDLPANAPALALLEELLPIRPGRSSQGRGGGLTEFSLREGAVSSVTRGQREVITRSLGAGQVVFVPGAVLEPAQAEFSRARQSAYALLCELAGATYHAPQGLSAKAPGFGTLALAAFGGDTTVRVAFENWDEAWRHFAEKGCFAELELATANAPTSPGRTVNGAVGTTRVVPPGATVEVPFLLTWHYPNKYNAVGTWMGCHYTTQWTDAAAAMQAAAANLESWRAKTELFRRTFYDSTLPYWLLDCLTANAAIIRHIGVVFRIANADTYGWEGSNGCCQPTCTHVWGYEQTLARLFPELERDMRRIDFRHQQRPDGGVNNRTDVPSPPRPTGEHPFADGHASSVLKAYREALHAADDSFFKAYWPSVKRAVEYLIARDAKAAGGEPRGILEDDQWNTYDQALHGVTTFISGYYLAALRAGEEWARRLGERDTAERFHRVFERGRHKLMELCWNGEYFQQHLPGYEKMPGEVGPGCMSDQLIGQWWAHQLGLGYLWPREQVVSALRAIFKYNWKGDLTGWKHMPRAFAGGRDKGLIICTWPKGGRPPHVMLYSDEVWTGIEYQVAAHLIYEGLIEEGFAIVKAARDRYDGVPRRPIPRNPWNEIECGGHYARAMSSWSLLLALSGWEYDGLRQTLRCAPRHTPDQFRAFFCGPEGWGRLRQTRTDARQRNEFILAAGRLSVSELRLSSPAAPQRVSASVNGEPCRVSFTANGSEVRINLAEPLVLREGQTLAIELG